MSGATPGPWEIHDTTSGYVIAGEYGEVTTVPRLPDARLISAAPDLLETAEYLWTALEDVDDTEEAVLDMKIWLRGVFNKIEGVSSEEHAS